LRKKGKKNQLFIFIKSWLENFLDKLLDILLNTKNWEEYAKRKKFNFGEKIFVVEDRMAEKYGLQVDIWISNQEKAKKFGIQYLKMEIF